MGVLDSLLRSRRTRRFPWDEALPDGTSAIDVLRPRRTMEVGTGELDPVVAAPPQPVSLEGPGPRIFSEGAPVPVLQPPPTLRRTISLAPEVEGMPAEALTPLPPEALTAQRRLTRPQLQNTGDQSADLQRYEQSLSEWKDPADRNGRLKSFGLGALRGLMRGLATGGGLGAGIGGALAGGIHGGVSPNADEREWRDAEVARTQQQQATLQGRRLGALKLRGMEADVAKTEAERDALLNPKPKELTPHYETRDDGTYVVDSKNPDGRKLAGVPGKPSPEKARQREWIDDGQGSEVLHQYDEAGVPQMILRGEKPVTRPGKQLIDYKLSDGRTVKVSPAAAATADATRSERDYRHGRDTVKDAQEEAAAIFQNERDTFERTKAEVKEYNDLVAAGEQARRAALALSKLQASLGEGERLTDAQQIQLDEATRLHDSIMKQIEGRKVESPYAEIRPDGRYRLKAEPKRQALQRRSVGASPRQAAPRTPPVSEEAYLNTARERLGSAFDEAKARAAYRQRYGR